MPLKYLSTKYLFAALLAGLVACSDSNDSFNPDRGLPMSAEIRRT